MREGVLLPAGRKRRVALPPSSVQFLNVPMFRNVTLKCLTEIAGVSVSQYEEQFVTLFTLTMMQLKQVLILPVTLMQNKLAKD